VRYADTVGYHGDQPHSISPYRDWVIKAFLDDVPFDRFTVLQLAGDLVGPQDGEHPDDPILASAYNRLLQTTHEGGLQAKEYRAIYQADRIRSVSGAWMGATIGCAQCHDQQVRSLHVPRFPRPRRLLRRHRRREASCQGGLRRQPQPAPHTARP
jgi:hypothetical protein